MPKQLIETMKKGYQGKGLTMEQIAHRVYGGLNNLGFMHGSKETAKGAAAEQRFVSDHRKGKRR